MEPVSYTHRITYSQEMTVKSKGSDMSGYLSYQHLHNYSATLVNILIIILITSAVYKLFKYNVTKVAMEASDKDWNVHIIRFGMNMIYALFIMGAVLGAICGRQLLGRKVTVDWISVLLGNMLIVLVAFIPFINIMFIVSLYALTLSVMTRGYIISR